MPRRPFLSAGSLAPRSRCHSVSEHCGSASTSRHGREGWLASAARWAVNVLLPDPPLREAKTIVFTGAAPVVLQQGEAATVMVNAWLIAVARPFPGEHGSLI